MVDKTQSTWLIKSVTHSLTVRAALCEVACRSSEVKAGIVHAGQSQALVPGKSFTCWLHQFPPTAQTLVIEVDCTLELHVGVK